MISLLLLGLLAGVQEDPPLPPSNHVHVLARADVWFASFEASGGLSTWFGRDESPQGRPRFSYRREGRLDDVEPVPGIEVQVVFDENETRYRGFRAMFRRGSWSESDILDAPFTVDGTTVPAGGPFQSRFRMWEAAVGGVGGIRPQGFPGEVWGWVGCEVHIERFRMETSAGALTDGSGGLNLNAGAHVEIRPLPFLFAAGELSGGLGFGSPEVQTVASAGLTWSGARIEAGYRHFWSVGMDAEPSFRLSMGGLFVGASIRF